MKFVFTFNEINYGRIEIEADQKPDNSEITQKILSGEATYNATDFTDFKLVEADDAPGSFKVTITETLQKTVVVKAGNREEAKQAVSYDWRTSKHILDADDFVGVEFNVVPGE